MSIEDETIELSLAYHGLREENQELKALLQEYHDMLDEYVGHGHMRALMEEVKGLQQRAKLFLEPAAGE